MKKNNNIFFIKQKGIKFYLPYYKQDSIQKCIVQTKNFYESDYLNLICSLKDGVVENAIQGKNVLDIGTNIGNHTIFFSKIKNARQVFCFEPVKGTFNILQKNIEINHLENSTHLFNCGVGESKGAATVKYFNLENTGTAQLKTTSDGEIPIVAIDDLHIKESVSFVKIDVEGFELNVIKGMLNTIKACRPVIMIEIRNHLFKEINNILEALEYEHITVDIDVYNVGNYLYYPKTANR